MMALWVAVDNPALGTPTAHPPGTPCEREAGGPIEVNVRIAELAAADGIRERDNFSFVAFTRDFRRSARTFLSVPEPRLPSGRLVLCLKQSDTLVATVWGWEKPGRVSREFEPGSRIRGGAILTIPGDQLPPANSEVRRQINGDGLTAVFEVATVGPGRPRTCVGSGTPEVRILSPPSDLFVTPGTVIRFVGEGSDPEDRVLPAESLSWTSDIDGFLGNGNEIQVPLSGPRVPCEPESVVHRVSLSGVDVDGHRATAQVSVRVGRIC